MLSKRERKIAMFTGAALVAAGVVYAYGWVQDQFDDLETQKTKLTRELDKATQTMNKHQMAARQWKQFVAQGLTQDAGTAESGLLNSLANWSADARLNINSFRNDRTSMSDGLHDMSYDAAADGSLRTIANFLYRVETSTIPVRARELQLSTKKEGVDVLSMELRLSTLWDDPNATALTPAAPSPTGGAQP